LLPLLALRDGLGLLFLLCPFCSGPDFAPRRIGALASNYS
jgi:hypothetical protein